jgi:hypothetical protein
MISELKKFSSVRHIVSVSTLDLVGSQDVKPSTTRTELHHLNLPVDRKRRKSRSRDRSERKKDLLEEGNYPSLRIDIPSVQSASTLKRDLYEDGYGLKFVKQRMFVLNVSLAVTPQYIFLDTTILPLTSTDRGTSEE